MTNRDGAARDEEMNLLKLRNDINHTIGKAKAPDTLQLVSTAWKVKNNLLLMKALQFQATDLDTFSSIINEIITSASPGKIAPTKNEKWTKVIVHCIPLKDYPDNAIGM